MDEVSMNDGLDTPETIAFGLGAVETAAMVLALLGAYLLTRSGLPAALAWGLAGLTALSGAALAWLRLADRSLLDWTVRLGAHCWRRRGEVVSVAADTGDRVAAWVRTRVPPRPRLPRRHPVLPGRAHRGLSIAAGMRRRAEHGAVTVRLLHPGTPAASHPGRPTAAVGAPTTRRAWRLGVFSLRGGVGRTTVACELAAVLAARGRAAAGAGRPSRRLRVTLLDLDGRLPAAALRLGLPLWAASGEVRQRHASGLELLGGAPDGDMDDASLGDLVDSIEAAGSDLIVLDLPSHLSPLCRAALPLCDEVAVIITPTPGGVLDGYRSTAALRSLGLRHRLLHVLNRAVEGFDATELMGDLGIPELISIPDDSALRAAEDAHGVCALEGSGAAALALCALAADINMRANGAAVTAGVAERWGGRAG